MGDLSLGFEKSCVEIEQKLVGCRRAGYHALDCIRLKCSSEGAAVTQSLLAFSNDRAVYVTNLTGTRYSLVSHEGIVNCLRCQRLGGQGNLYGTGVLVSGDAAGALCVWRPQGLIHRFDLAKLFSTTDSATDHSLFSIVCLAVPPGAGEVATVGTSGPLFSCTSGGYLYAFEYANTASAVQLTALPESVDCLPLGSGAIRSEQSFDGCYLVFVGNTIGTIEGFLYNSKHQTFARTTTIEGHADCIRDVALHVMDIRNQCADQLQNRRNATGHVLLASASQDGTARLWLVASSTHQGHLDLIDDPECLTVLYDHQSAVTTVKFIRGSCCADERPRLLTAAFDRTVKLWELSGDSAPRIQRVAEMGVIGEQSSFHGFYSAAYGEWDDGQSVVFATTYTGAVFQWRNASSQNLWRNDEPCIRGHNLGVTDLDWCPPDGLMLVTVSRDMTCRLFAKAQVTTAYQWVELARPQVHGHEIFAVRFVGKSGLKLASAAEEKAVRLFDAPQQFVEELSGILQTTRPEACSDGKPRPVRASRIALSLTNQPEYEASESNEGEEIHRDLSPSAGRLGRFPASGASPRTEATLQQDTLWPECEQLFAHPNNVQRLDSIEQQDGSFILASACVAQSMRESAIQLWEIQDAAVELHDLRCHDLTVTDLRFAYRIVGKTRRNLLLSVARDRSWIVWNVHSREVISRRKNAHARMILTCAWVDPQQGLFATGGRDKCIHLWQVSNFDAPEAESLAEPLQSWRLHSAVTAMDVFSDRPDRAIVLAGLESGALHGFSVSTVAPYCSKALQMSENVRHVRAVSRIRFRPRSRGVFASCSEDGSVMIARILTTEKNEVADTVSTF